MARNRKRAKERRARRPQPVASRRAARDDAPGPIAHGTPDVELAEAQLAMGRQPANEDEASDGVVADEVRDDEAPVADDDVGEEDLEDVVASDQDDFDDEDEFEQLASERGGVPGIVGVTPTVERGSKGEIPVADSALPARRPGHRNRLVNFLQGSWAELQRVQWPDRRQVVQATGVVIGFVIVAGVFLGVADLLAGKIVDFILK